MARQKADVWAMAGDDSRRKGNVSPSRTLRPLLAEDIWYIVRAVFLCSAGDVAVQRLYEGSLVKERSKDMARGAIDERFANEGQCVHRLDKKCRCKPFSKISLDKAPERHSF